MKLLWKHIRRRSARLRLETLEERTVPSVNLVGDFENGSLSDYKTVLHYYPSADIAAAAAHDGLVGLDKHDGYEWMVGRTPALQVQRSQGATISVWTQLADTADGRAYLGFGTTPPNGTTDDYSSLHGLALVLAPNTNQLLLQSFGGTSFTTLSGATQAQTYQPNQWYRAEVTWNATGSITGRLYDSDGTTLLNTVTGTNTPITGGGISLRAFGHDKYFDSIVVDTDSSGSTAQRANAGGGLDPNWVYQTPPPAPTDGAPGGAVPIPWQYTSVPGTGRDIEISSWGQLAVRDVVGDQVVLAGSNTSHNVGTVGVDWGPQFGGPADPQLAQYIFRQLPGQTTQLISTASVKHFFAPYILSPGSFDTYASSHNWTESLFTYGSELNPVTGELIRQNDIGPVDVNGINQYTRPNPSQLDVLQHVSIADLDPAQNPPGTRWFSACNAYVEGDQDVTNNSRWVEFVPQRNGSNWTFSYPNGSTGQLNFRTIPGLVQGAGPIVTSSTPTGNLLGSVSSARVTFDRPIDVTTFTLAQVDSFTVTAGGNTTDLSGDLLSITPVSGSNNRSFDISFNTETTLGHYSLVIGPNILDLSGNPMDQNGNGIAGEVPDDEYTANFTLQGLKITASTPTGNNHLPGDLINSVTVTFNEPVDPSTFTTASIDDFYGPYGGIPINSVTPVAGSNNTRFLISFDPQLITGRYTMDIGPYINDLAGNPMDQNGNGIAGEYPDDVYTATFGIQGLQVTRATVNSTLPGQASSLRVTFNEAVNPDSFNFTQIPTFSGPDGDHLPTAIVPVDGTNLVFDVQFDPLTVSGSYTLVIGPNVNDVYGNAMDQDGNLIPGEPTDIYTANFSLTAPQLVSATLPTAGPYDHVRLVFDRAMDPTSFDPSEFTLSAPGGRTVTVTDVTAASSDNTTFDVSWTALTTPGNYNLAIGAGISDAYGNPLVALSRNFTIAAPHLLSASPPSTVPIDHVRLVFDKAMDPTTINTSEFNLTDPTGGTVTITDVAAVGSSNTTFDVSFSPLTISGTYTLAIGAGITDSAGITLAPVTATFRDVPSYSASATTFQNIELFGQTGTQTLTFQGGGVTADDDFGVINLGAGNNFNFYGTVYTQLYVSSNGLVTFGSGNTAYIPSSLTGSPAQAAIAPYWTDLIKTGTEPMILWTITNNQLIIEWYHVSNYPDGSSIPMTFQAILNLNTAGGPGDIVLNYVTVTGVGAGDANGGITVGVKDAGAGSATSNTVVQDGTGGGHGNPLIQSGHAIRFS